MEKIIISGIPDVDFSKLHLIFNIPESDYQVTRLKHGHINKTYLIKDSGDQRFILQQVNTGVFQDPERLMANYRLVSETLSAFAWPQEQPLSCPELLLTRTGKPYFTNDSADCWRMITYISGADCPAIPHNSETAYQGGLAFGLFLRGVSGIKPDDLHEILPDFHSLDRRYNEFLDALDTAPAERKASAEQEIRLVLSRYESMKVIPDAFRKGEIPKRVVHNDTKLSNVIFSDQGKFRGVIDLDTVMPGSALFDFGDAIRSSANTACEDEQDPGKVRFDTGLFSAFAKGFTENAGSLLTKAETDLMPESALLMTYIIGMRFLTDYLNQDIYYLTDYETHNLVRAGVQFALIRQMEPQLPEMHRIIEKHMKSVSNQS